MQQKILSITLEKPKTIMLAVAVLFVGLGAQIPRVIVDTDPENMLPADQAARVFHNQVKTDFTLYDLIVVGIVNETDPDGVFNPSSLGKVLELTRGIERIEGVVRQDLLSLATVDNISPGGEGVVRFEWLMNTPPADRAAAQAIRAEAESNPVLYGTLVSEDAKATAMYVPIIEKSESHRISVEIESIIAGFEGDEQFYISGLPVAEDTFGVEMFKQMGIAAPLAGLIIFLLMWFFFRSLALIASPMILAIVTVVATMGLLIGMGFTVHIMSSMIPIFLMPIAVVDSVHILSEFADLYPRIGDRKKTIKLVMAELFQPLLFTSLTSAVGFASLALAPIPPVQVFGVFVAFGILLAFVLTITFIPAYVVQLNDARIAKLLRPAHAKESLLAGMLTHIGSKTATFAKPALVAAALLVALSVGGIYQIDINDNPVRWFQEGHRIRVADKVLNEHFGGTYNAYLVLNTTGASDDPDQLSTAVNELLEREENTQSQDVRNRWNAIWSTAQSASPEERIDVLLDALYDALDAADEAEAALWEQALTLIEDRQSASKYFQTPVALRYIEALQTELLRSTHVGKSNSVVDIVKTVHRELRDGNPDYFTIPGNASAVAQTLLSYQSSHRPKDIWHFVTPDYRGAVIWVQLKSGDNQDMLAVTRSIERYLEQHPPPEGVTAQWAGLTYLNVVWQNEMVSGMLSALLGSFAIVFVMMLLLFRSFWFGVLAMLPLSITIGFVYGLIGWIGKDYDMPIAVLSSLTLGLSVDFAIHFLERARKLHAELGDWSETVKHLFREPARAISRNALVIAIGFLPLVFSPLVPYNTVGYFLAAIMATSCVVTLIMLPSAMQLLRKRIFRKAAVQSETDHVPV